MAILASIAIIFPVVSAIIYPTYTNRMESQWVEWTRLLEFPFVFLELSVIAFAYHKKFDNHHAFLSLAMICRVFLLIFIFSIFFSSIFVSFSPHTSIVMSIITLVHIIFFASLYFLGFGNSNIRPETVVLFHGAGLVLIAFYTAYRFSFLPEESDVFGGIIRLDNAIPGFISVRHFGSWAGAITAAFAVWLLFGDWRSRGIVVPFFYYLSSSLTIWSGTRAAILSIMLVVGLFVFLRRSFPPLKNVMLAVLLTIAAWLSAIPLLPDNSAFHLFQSEDLAGAHQLSGGRLLMWSRSIERWSEAPYFGWGSGSTFWEVDFPWPHTQPHNVVIQFLITWGIVGTVSGLFLLSALIRRSYSDSIKDFELWPLFAMLYSLLIMSLFEGMLHYPRFIMLILFLFACLIRNDGKPAAARA